eukprot:scaffold31277_cov18-Tisochrysis_lutea.AAC.3
MHWIEHHDDCMKQTSMFPSGEASSSKEEEEDVEEASESEEEQPKKKGAAKKAPATKKPKKEDKPKPAKITETTVLDDGWTAQPPSLLYRCVEVRKLTSRDAGQFEPGKIPGTGCSSMDFDSRKDASKIAAFDFVSGCPCLWMWTAVGVGVDGCRCVPANCCNDS